MTDAAGPPFLAWVERRSSERLPLLGDVRGEALVPQPMTVVDLSAGGIRVETEFPFYLSSIHELRIPMADRVIVARARVTYCAVIDVEAETVRYRSGFEFVDLPERTRGAIDAFVESVRAQRRGTISS